MTTTPSPTSSEAERAKLDDLAIRHANALLREQEASEAWEAADAQKVLGEVDEDAEQQAKSALTEAQADTASLARAMALVKTRIADAEEREAEERRAEIAAAAKEGDRERGAARKRLANALASAEAAFEAFDRSNRTAAQLRSEAIRLRDLDRQEAELNERYRERIEELRQTAPEGMEPNFASLELRFEQELRNLREAARAEAESLAPPAGDEALREIVDAHAGILPRLVDTATRRALSEGLEFTRLPEPAGHLGRSVSFSGRLYADHELPEAEARHGAFIDALRRLGGPPAARIGAEYAKQPGGLTVQH